MASPVKLMSTPSVASSAVYCLVSAFCGSVRIRTKSSFVRLFSSTRRGKRPCISGIRSAGFETWKAPAAMKRIWSVRTIPCLVLTVEPSTIGRRSRCTPSRDPSGPDRLGDPLVHVDQFLRLLLSLCLPGLLFGHLVTLSAVWHIVFAHLAELIH